jgi:hypothetical protein
MVELLPAPEECGLPTASDIIPAIQEWIDEVGIEQAFKIVGTILLYSGPKDEIVRACRRITSDRNHDKVKKLLDNEPDDKNYTLLDKTDTGVKLEEYGGKGISIFAHLKNLYKEKYKGIYGEDFDDEHADAAEAIASVQANMVMSHVSEAFIDAAHGDVETCVCGADLEKVFYQTELPALMRSKRITAINGVDIEEYRKIYFSGDEHAKYLTFTLICQNELAMIHGRALAASGDEAAYHTDDYATRKEFFRLEQEMTAEEFRKEALHKMEATKQALDGEEPTRPQKSGKVIPVGKVAGLH